MRRTVWALVSVMGILATTVSASGAAESDAAVDIEAGAALYKKECRGCHGPTAKGLSSYPKLVEKTTDYLIDRLERYRAGEKFGPNTPLMAPRAKNLSDEEIVNISNFITSLN